MNIYPPKVQKYARKKKFIIRRIKDNEHLKNYKRYWDNSSEMCFKVHQVYTVQDNEYYSVRFSGLLFSELCYPADVTYELKPDVNNIAKRTNIINSRRSYTGAEIKYWFMIRQIDLNSEKYEGFVSFLDPTSKSVISDDKYYFINAKLKNNIYSDCKIVLNRHKGG